ncbi:MAG: acyl-CoA dehydrogenase family protein [Myxococcota bacterium]
MMNFTLTPEQQLLQSATRGFAKQHLESTASSREKAHSIGHDVIRQLAQQGLLGVNVDEALGGAEAGVVAYAVALREIAAADASVAVTMAVTNMVAEVISKFGSDAQRRQYVPKLTSGEYFGGAFALSEPGAGSDVAGMTTKAEPDGEGWVLNGQKMWITTGDLAGVVVVWARTGQEGHRDISCFLVEQGTAGMVAGKPEEKMGLRASHTVALTFDNVKLPATALLAKSGEGFRIAMTALNGGRIGIASQALGIAWRALEVASQHVKQRQQFGKTLANFQAIQFKLADMGTQLDAAWLLILRAAWLKEQGEDFVQEAAMAKVFASETANRVVRAAVQILGGYGYMEEGLVARLYRDCRVTQIYEGTSEIQRLVIARMLLKAA